MKKLLNLLCAVNLVVIELISVVSCGSESKVKKIVTKTPRSETETINHESVLGASNPNKFKFDISKISQKEILLDEKSNDEFLTKQSILETDISEKVKRAILELLKKIDNSLTENDFIVDFSENFPVDIRNKTNINIKAKISEKNNNNNSVEIIINIRRSFYTDVKIISIESPQKIIAKDPRKVTKEELKKALLPEILKSLEKLNPGFPNAVNIDYISIREFEIENINFPLNLSSEKILTKFNINFKFVSGMIPTLVFAPDINLNNFKLPMALKN